MARPGPADGGPVAGAERPGVCHWRGAGTWPGPGAVRRVVRTGLPGGVTGPLRVRLLAGGRWNLAREVGDGACCWVVRGRRWARAGDRTRHGPRVRVIRA